MGELELFQGRQRGAALLGELDPAALELVGLAKPVFRGRDPGPPQERQRDDDDSGDSEQDAEREPDVHTPNASGLCPRVRLRVPPWPAARAPGSRAPRT